MRRGKLQKATDQNIYNDQASKSLTIEAFVRKNLRPDDIFGYVEGRAKNVSCTRTPSRHGRRPLPYYYSHALGNIYVNMTMGRRNCSKIKEMRKCPAVNGTQGLPQPKQRFYSLVFTMIIGPNRCVFQCPVVLLPEVTRSSYQGKLKFCHAAIKGQNIIWRLIVAPLPTPEKTGHFTHHPSLMKTLYYPSCWAVRLMNGETLSTIDDPTFANREASSPFCGTHVQHQGKLPRHAPRREASLGALAVARRHLHPHPLRAAMEW